MILGYLTTGVYVHDDRYDTCDLYHIKMSIPSGVDGFLRGLAAMAVYLCCK